MSEDYKISDLSSYTEDVESDPEKHVQEAGSVTWTEWIKRATGFAETAAKKAQIVDWMTEQRRRK